MAKFKIVNLIDKLFITCATFLIIYAWINFYIRNLWTTFILSLIFCSATLYVFYFFINKKQTRENLNKQQIQAIDLNYYVFKLTPTKQKLTLLKEIFKKYNPTIKNLTLRYERNNKKTMLVFATKYDIIDNKILLNIIDEFNDEFVDEIHIVCCDIVNNINTKIFVNTEIKFITKKILYLDYFLKHNIFPDQTNINLNSTKLTLNALIKNMFNSYKAKGYFLCGFVLIFSSIILPYHFYYLIVGSTLLLFALICKILPYVKD